jgi:hypothetical protein
MGFCAPTGPWDAQSHPDLWTVAAPGNADLQIGSDHPRERQLQCTFARPEACWRLPSVEV